MFLGKQPERTFKILTNGVAQANVEKVTNKKQRGAKKFNLANDHIDIVALGEGDPTSINKRMKMIEDQFMGNPALHDPAFMRKKETTK